MLANPKNYFDFFAIASDVFFVEFSGNSEKNSGIRVIRNRDSLEPVATTDISESAALAMQGLDGIFFF